MCSCGHAHDEHTARDGCAVCTCLYFETPRFDPDLALNDLAARLKFTALIGEIGLALMADRLFMSAPALIELARIDREVAELREKIISHARVIGVLLCSRGRLAA